MPSPLAGIRVLDLTNVLAGPFCCHQLAHLGAEVLKVETPAGGDLARQLGADAELNRRGMGHEALRAHNPTLVYCAISGFGHDGPLRDAPAYDQIVQDMSGMMSITGAPDTAPYPVGYPVADTLGGLTAAMAVCAALAERERVGGRFIDVSMLESAVATMGWAVSGWLVAGRAPQPMGSDNVTASPSGTFRTADGLLNVAANRQAQFEALCTVIGRPGSRGRRALRRAPGPSRAPSRAHRRDRGRARRWQHRARVACAGRCRRARGPGLDGAAGARPSAARRSRPDHALRGRARRGARGAHRAHRLRDRR
jgi:crotonobetainyl-CoA:carnitine CoA-transferase CaiB-like acyl-CoA transferase